jgi:uncharacterized protein YhhL (DUF1145 family)
LKINVITTLILAAIGLIADIVTILAFSFSKAKGEIGDAHAFGLYLIGLLIVLSILNLYWDKYKDEKKYEKTFWLFILKNILFKFEIKVLSPILILTIGFMTMQGMPFNVLFTGATLKKPKSRYNTTQKNR